MVLFSYLPLPGGISEGPHGSGDNLTVGQNSGAFIPGGGGKPSGSLPDLTNFHVNSQSPSPCSGPNVASGESSNGQAMPFCQSLSTAAVCSPNYSPVSVAQITVFSNMINICVLDKENLDKYLTNNKLIFTLEYHEYQIVNNKMQYYRLSSNTYNLYVGLK